MSVLIREDKSKERVAEPVRLTAVFPCPADALHRTYRDVKLADLSFLYPDAHLRDLALSAAKNWVSHMKMQEFDLLDNESDLKVWGPYRPKTKVLKNRIGEAGAGMGFSSEDNPFPDGEAEMLLTGFFLARRQQVIEVN